MPSYLAIGLAEPIILVLLRAIPGLGGSVLIFDGWWRLAFLIALPLGLTGWCVRT